MVDLAPFAYLDERYDGDLVVLWVDTHPDVMTTDVNQNAHAMVMGNPLGEGDEDFVAAVKRPIEPQNVMFAGRLDTLGSLPDVPAMDTALFDRLKLRSARPEELADTVEPVVEWLIRPARSMWRSTSISTSRIPRSSDPCCSQTRIPPCPKSQALLPAR